jgi:hypothetical protein
MASPATFPAHRPDLAERFRDAVSSGEFERASRIWDEYAGERLADARRGCGDRLSEMRELTEWARTVCLCFRAQALRTLRTRLTEMHAADAYGRVTR